MIITASDGQQYNTHHWHHSLHSTQFIHVYFFVSGVSAAFLADIKPQTDGCNGLKYNLTADIIECVFKTYPAVKRKHNEYVPAKLNESEFWTKFFQSHYFHRDRIMTGTKDLFTECGKIDDQALKQAVAANAGDVLLDLRAFDDSTLEEGFGGAPTSKSGVNSGNIVHQNMIKRFNQHSTMVLNTCLSKVTAAAATTSANNNNGHGKKHDSTVTNGTKNHNGGGVDAVDGNANGEPNNKRQRINDKIRYDDLLGDGNDDSHQSGSNGKPVLKQLNLVKVERYLHGPVPISYQADPYDDTGNLEATQIHMIKCTETWNTRTPQKVLVDPKAAVNALGELTPGGALMRGFQEQSLARKFRLSSPSNM